MTNCVDIVRPFNEAISGRDDIQLIGGIGSAALTDERTAIVTDEKRVVAPADLFLSQYRGPGNLRDLEALVLTTDNDRRAEVEALAEELIGDELEIDMFNLKPADQLIAQRQQPLHASAMTFLADRYAKETTDGQIAFADKALFPFAVPMHPETLETWRLYIGEADKYPAPIPHPGTVILNYMTRAAYGPRHKDRAKLHEMATNIAKKAPETRDWIADGPGQSQLDLARIHNQLGNNGKQIITPVATIDGLRGNLREHPAFMIPDAPLSVQLTVLGITRLEAVLDNLIESNPRFVHFWQRRIMNAKSIAKITHND